MKIDVEKTLEKNGLGDPPKITCLSKEREARRHMRVVEACTSRSEIVLGLLKHVTQGKARERRDSKQTIVEQRKRRKRKQGYASESMGKQGKPRASTRELRSLALLARFARPTRRPTSTIAFAAKNDQKQKSTKNNQKQQNHRK